MHKNRWYLKNKVEEVETRFDTSNYDLKYNSIGRLFNN